MIFGKTKILANVGILHKTNSVAVVGLLFFTTISILAVKDVITYKTGRPVAIINTASAETVLNPQTQSLLQGNNLEYLGAFRLPSFDNASSVGATYGFDYATGGLAYNPANNSLFVNNHVYEQKTAEVSIPTNLTKGTKLSDLAMSTFLQTFGDITQGNLKNVGLNGASVNTSGTIIGGLLVYGNKLLGTVYGYYDAGYVVDRSHFVSSLNTSQPNFAGMYKMGDLNPAFYGGYMGLIPPEWQALFGGKALTGNCCLSIIGRTSAGPSVSVFDPDALDSTSPTPATTLIGYPINHATLGTYADQRPDVLYNGSMAISGVVFPQDSRSVLFFGRRGLGTFCYGAGTSDITLDRKPLPEYPNGEVVYCYDPTSGSKGGHSYPYVYEVFAYDANELLTVKNGQKNYWDVLPYAHWVLDDFPVVGGAVLQGVAYDPSTQKIYVSQGYGEQAYSDASPYNARSLIHVYKVNNVALGTVDNPPTISIVAPITNAQVDGVINISTAAADDHGIQSVQIKLDGQNLGGIDTSFPYSYSWNTALYNNGSHTITAVVKDTAGYQTTSLPVIVNVNNVVTEPVLNSEPQPTPTPTPTPTPETPLPTQPAPPHSGSIPKDGSLVVYNGVVYFMEQGKKRPFTSMEVYQGLGYKLSLATSQDLSQIQQGEEINTNNTRHPRATLVSYNGTVYFMGNSFRYPFPSKEVFLSWSNRFEDVVPANQYDLQVPEGPLATLNINNSTRHSRGALVVYNGTVYFMGNSFRYPFPSKEVFLSWSNRFEDVVPANTADLAIPEGPLAEMKQ